MYEELKKRIEEKKKEKEEQERRKQVTSVVDKIFKKESPVVSFFKKEAPLTSKVVSNTVPVGKELVKQGGKSLLESARKDVEEGRKMTFTQQAKRDLLERPLKVIEFFTKPLVQAPLSFATKAGLSGIEAVTGKPQSVELGSIGKEIFGTDKLNTFQKIFVQMVHN